MAIAGRLGSGGFNTQPPKGGWESRLAAVVLAAGFNTQPPKGGWTAIIDRHSYRRRFNTQPPKGGWGCTLCVDCQEDLVSTHSRLKAAGRANTAPFKAALFQHTAA